MLKTLFSWLRPAEPQGGFGWEHVVLQHGTLLVRWKDIFSHTLVYGCTGSGKTTGPLRMYLRALIRSGASIVLFCVKASDKHEFQEVITSEGAQSRLKLLSPGHEVLNPFDQESLGRGGRVQAENIRQLMMQLKEINDRFEKKSQGGDEFFVSKGGQVIRNLAFLIIKAYGLFSMQKFQQCLHSLPLSPEDIQDEAWQESSVCYQTAMLASAKCVTDLEVHEYGLAADLLREWSVTNDRTRSSVFAVVTSISDPVDRGIAYQLLGGRSTFNLDVLNEGTIVLVDAPPLELGPTALLVNGAIKNMVFRWAQARRTTDATRPVILFMDEAHWLVNRGTDALALTTLRSVKCGVVASTQSITNFYTALGQGRDGEYEAQQYAGSFQTKIFANCGQDPTMCDYAASVCGKRLTMMNNGSFQADPNKFNPLLFNRAMVNVGYSQTVDYTIRPHVFSELRKPSRQFPMVETVIARGSEKPFRFCWPQEII